MQKKKSASQLKINTLNPDFQMDSSPNLPTATSGGKTAEAVKTHSAKEL
jgi:hypothetical protein